ncbi:HEPN/Toprim-associated domain-containing protein [Pseudovibrio sp. Ad26]|uniref:HEPN/Toprim-associated domain-containing protein n=1 Tax=Pseudovibrio sp. Ad26 TaxID=989410 RepID=UPI0012907963|nr:HEPN/Toprim-associated domain-containing protein [Pseudovibrio sp. Ad26]
MTEVDLGKNVFCWGKLGKTMGTYIALTVGRLELTSSKNMLGPYHGDLFLDSDRKEVPDPLGNPEEKYPAFQTTVEQILPRIELMGHTLDRAREEYNYLVERAIRRQFDIPGEGQRKSAEDFLTFEQFIEIVRTIPVSEVSTGIDEDHPNPKRICDAHTLKKLPWYDPIDYIGREPDDIHSEASSAAFFIDGFHAYTQIRLSAENQVNLSSHVTWMYGPLVENGWAYEDEFNTGLSDGEKFLIVTEGSSDAKIIRHAFNLLCPQVEDFFDTWTWKKDIRSPAQVIYVSLSMDLPPCVLR